MTKEENLPNSNQSTFYLIAWTHERTSEGDSRAKKEAIPIKLLTDKEVKFDGLLGMENSEGGEFMELAPKFLIMANEYYSVKQEITTILEASIVNANQLKALKSLVDKAFDDKMKELFSRTRI